MVSEAQGTSLFRPRTASPSGLVRNSLSFRLSWLLVELALLRIRRARFQETLRHRSTVYRHKWLVFAEAGVMNALSQELFTSSRLPMNQYRGIHSRISFGPFNHLHERGLQVTISLEPILSHMTLEMRLPAYIGFNVLKYSALWEVVISPANPRSVLTGTMFCTTSSPPRREILPRFVCWRANSSSSCRKGSTSLTFCLRVRVASGTEDLLPSGVHHHYGSFLVGRGMPSWLVVQDVLEPLGTGSAPGGALQQSPAP